MRRRALLVLMTSWLTLGGTAALPPVRAAEEAGPAKDETAQPLRFRRVFAPADRMKDWPRGDAKYLPIDAAEFDRLLAAARSAAPGAGAPKGVRAVAAQYTARWDQSQTLRGEATLDIAQTAGSPVLLPLGQCNLALGKARWLGADPAPAAVLGLDDDGKLQTLVERSGRLGLEWSLRGRRDGSDAATFSFELPPCPINRLALDLPLTMVPLVDRGILVDSHPAGEELRRWEIELGGHNRCRLRIVPAGVAEQQRRLALARQSLIYDLSLRGAEVSVQLKLEAYEEPLRQVTLLMDPQLRLVTALRGDTAVPWSVVSPPGAPLTRLVVTLPEPIRDGTGVLRLRALAPLAMGKPWRLPRIYPEGMFWQEGDATLLVPGPLVVERLTPVGCRQTGVGPLSAPQAGQSAQFEYFAPDATVELVLAQRRTALEVQSATATELGNGKMTSRVAADFRTADATQFSLEAQVAPLWTVDSIESSPADALDDWSFDKPDDSRALTVRLAKALSPSRPVRLVIVARRLYAGPGDKLGIEDLLPLRFPAATEERPLVAVRATGSCQVKVMGGERLTRLSPEGLGAADLDRFGGSPGELLFRNDAGAAALKVSLESRKPSYSATIQVEAVVGAETLREDYLLRCTPSPSARVDRVLVRFSHWRRAALRWSLGKEDEQALSARRLPGDEQWAAGRPGEEETWELTLRRPRSEAFEIRASRETKLAGPEPISLASLPDATQKQASLVLRSVGSKALEVKNSRLKAVAIGAPPPGQCQTIRAAFQYDPVADASAVPEPPLLVSTAEAACLPRIWVWHGELQSHYTPDGSGQHAACYRLQSCGETSLRLGLPAGTSRRDVHGLRIDGAAAAARPGAEDDRELTIDLPSGEQYPTVTIQFSTRGDRLGTIGRLELPLPEADVPVLWQHWSVWLPPGYELPEYLPDPEQSAPRQFTWSQRLFGPLGRAAGPSPAPQTNSPLPWATSAAGAKSPWLEARVPDYAAEDAPGWTAYRLPVTKTSSAGLTVVHRATLRLLGSLAFLLVLGIGWWWAADRPRTLSVAAAALAVTALLVPAAYIAVASGAVLGASYCLLLRLVRPARAGRPAAAPTSAQSGSTPLAGVGLPAAVVLALTLLLLGSSARGAAPEGKAAEAKAADAERGEKKDAQKKAPPAPYAVFIPVDEHDQPTGGKYYVPEPFYEQLYRRAALKAEKPQGWLIASAVYRAALSKEAMSQRLAVEELRVDFDLHVFGRGARVRIPLRRDEAKLLPDGSLLDGRAIQPEWQADGNALLLDVAEAGQYRLELALRPAVRASAAGLGFDLAIPRLATSRLELTLPEGAPAIEVPSAAGAVSQEEQATRLVAELGPAERLTVRWQDAAAAAAAIDAEELFWLKIQPGSVVIDAKLKLKVAAGQIRRLQLLTDPALQLLPLAGPDPPSVRVRTPAGQPQIIELQWARPVTESTVIDAEFLLTGASSVGNLRLPQIDIADVRPTKRWLAVSVDPALEHQAQMPGRLDAVAVPEFAASWGATQPTPLLACRLAPGPSRWSITTRPRRPEITADETLVLDFDGKEAALQLDARLTVSSGGVFQHRLLAPAELKIDGIVVSAGGVQRASRWTVDPSGAITVFLMDPASGAYELTLRGRLPAPPGRKLPLPQIEIEGARVRSFALQVYRRPPVLVEVDPAAGLTAVKAPPAETEMVDQRRLVCRLRGLGTASPRATLTVRPNRPKVQAEQVIRVVPDGDSWNAVFDCRLQVSGGSLDQIVLDAPASWKGPLKVRPSSAVPLFEGRGESRRLTLRPRTAIAGDYEFTVSGSLAAAPGPGVGVPQIALHRPDGGRRFVVLPKRFQGEPITWELQGLQAVSRPELASGGQAASYLVVGTPFRAALRAAETSGGGGRVRLADIRIAWQLDGTCRGAATFDVESGNAAECSLSLPAGFRLIQASVGGVPMPPSPRTGLLPLGPAGATQRVEIVFDGGATECQTDETAGQSPGQPQAGRGIEAVGTTLPFSSTARWRLRAPMLGDLRVDKTRWTVAGPASLGAGVAEEPPAGDSARPGQRAAAEGPLGPAASLWLASLDDPRRVTVCAVEGRADALTLRYAFFSGGGLLGRLAAAALLAALAVAAALTWRRKLLGGYLARWPYAGGVVIGLAWWLWLWPGAVGLLIAFVAAALHVTSWLNRRAGQSPKVPAWGP